MPVYTPEKIEYGTPCPEFKLPATDGKFYSLSDFKKGSPFVVMFICNHCPYVQAIEDRLITLGHDLKKQGIELVAICSNDAISYPDDSFINLKKRAEEKKYSFVYLHDESQEVARKFGAICTPDYFGYDKDGRLAYRGRLDDSWKDPSLVQNRELYNSMLELKNTGKITFKQTPSMGCSIKWVKS